MAIPDSLPLRLARDLYGPQVASHHVIDGKAHRAEDIEAALLLVAEERDIPFTPEAFKAPEVTAAILAALAGEPVITPEEAEVIAAPWSYLDPQVEDIVDAAALGLPVPEPLPEDESVEPGKP